MTDRKVHLTEEGVARRARQRMKEDPRLTRDIAKLAVDLATEVKPELQRELPRLVAPVRDELLTTWRTDQQARLEAQKALLMSFAIEAQSGGGPVPKLGDFQEHSKELFGAGVKTTTWSILRAEVAGEMDIALEELWPKSKAKKPTSSKASHKPEPVPTSCRQVLQLVRAQDLKTYNAMRNAWESCRRAGCTPPAKVLRFFGFTAKDAPQTPPEQGSTVVVAELPLDTPLSVEALRQALRSTRSATHIRYVDRARM